MTTRITTATESFVTHYPQAITFANEQLKVLWFPDEPKLEKDVQDILVNMTEAERHGVITVLRLFTLYELFAGRDYWSDAVMKRYPRPEICRMAGVFTAFELGIHQPFYARLNELLNLSTDEFYLSYTKDPILKERIEFVDSIVNSNEYSGLLSTAGFSMVEGGVLYSAFGFLKHFQSQGKNKLLNVVRGINFSAIDENLHCEGGAWLFKTHLQEAVDSGELSEQDKEELFATIRNTAEKIYEHESRIVDMIFEKGKIEGITSHQLKNFVMSRLNICLTNLGVGEIYKVEYNPIAEWFYNGLNSYQFVDFFSGMGREYQRDWNEEGFVFKVENE